MADIVEKYSDRLSKISAPYTEQWFVQCRDLLDDCADLEEYYDRLPEIYPELESEDLERNVASATAAVALAGWYESEQDLIYGEVVEFADTGYADVPFEEAIAYFENKQNKPTKRWDDLSATEHDAYFTVAGAKAAVLGDIRTEIDKTIAEGLNRKDFADKFDAIAGKYGWDYKGGKDWRAGIIYQTNLRGAYGDGRCQQMTDPAVLAKRKYWQWIHGQSRVPRPVHVALNGKVFDVDHPLWTKLYCPAGYGCRCSVRSLSDRDLQKKGLTVEKGYKPGNFIDTPKGKFRIEPDPNFENSCTIQTDYERDQDRYQNRGKAIQNADPDIQKEIIKKISVPFRKVRGAIASKENQQQALKIAGGVAATAFVAGIAYIGYEFYRDTQATQQALIAIAQDVAAALNIREMVPFFKDILDPFFGPDLAKADWLVQQRLYGALAKIQAEVVQEATSPGYADLMAVMRSEMGLASPSEQYAYTFRLLSDPALHDDYRWALLKYQGYLFDTLGPEELAAISRYTTSNGYKQMNAALRGDIEAAFQLAVKNEGFKGTQEQFLVNIEADVRMATKGLNGLYPYKGPVYRGLSLPNRAIADMNVGDEIFEAGFTSTTKNPIRRYSGNVSFTIHSKTARNISFVEKFNNEEVLFAPGSRFKILSKRKVEKFGKSFWMIELEDLNDVVAPIPKITGVQAEVTEAITDTRIIEGDLTPEFQPPIAPEIPVKKAIATRTVSRVEYDQLGKNIKEALGDYRVRINKNTNAAEGTFNVQPTKKDGYLWTPEQAKAVKEVLEKQGIVFPDSFDPNNIAWQEGFNYLKIDARVQITDRPIGPITPPGALTRRVGEGLANIPQPQKGTDRYSAIELEPKAITPEVLPPEGQSKVKDAIAAFKKIASKIGKPRANRSQTLPVDAAGEYIDKRKLPSANPFAPRNILKKGQEDIRRTIDYLQNLNLFPTRQEAEQKAAQLGGYKVEPAKGGGFKLRPSKTVAQFPAPRSELPEGLTPKQAERWLTKVGKPYANRKQAETLRDKLGDAYRVVEEDGKFVVRENNQKLSISGLPSEKPTDPKIIKAKLIDDGEQLFNAIADPNMDRHYDLFQKYKKLTGRKAAISAQGLAGNEEYKTIFKELSQLNLEARDNGFESLAGLDTFYQSQIESLLPKLEQIDSAAADELIAGINLSFNPAVRKIITPKLNDVLRLTGDRGSKTLQEIIFDIDGQYPYALRPSDNNDVGVISLADTFYSIRQKWPNLADSEEELRRRLFHEVGHHVEFSTDSSKSSQQFIKDRATGDRKPLNEVDPTYSATVPVYPDDFVLAYTGRIYPDGDTELVSTGLEHLRNTQKAYLLYERDRQHFMYLIGLLRK